MLSQSSLAVALLLACDAGLLGRYADRAAGAEGGRAVRWMVAILVLAPVFRSPTGATTAKPDVSWLQIEGKKSRWLGGRDSNPDTQIQSLQSYH